LFFLPQLLDLELVGLVEFVEFAEFVELLEHADI
jgi:hypothetical protein